MAFKDSGKDSGDADGKKGKNTKTQKTRNPRNGRGSLVLVLIVLWLIGLTAAVAFFNLFMGPGPAGNLEGRVARLERQAGEVRGTVPPPGADDLATLTDRMDQLEARVAGGAAGTAGGAETADAAAGTMAGDCPCDRILSRLDRLEDRMVAMAGEGDEPATAAAEETPSESQAAADADAAEDTETAAEETAPAPRKVARKTVRPGTRKPRPPQDIPGVEVRSYGRDGRVREPVLRPDRTANQARTSARPAPAEPVYSRDGAFSEDVRRGTQTESVYEITRRMAPLYGYTEGEMRNMERLAPGAAIYPGNNNGGYVGSVLSN